MDRNEDYDRDRRGRSFCCDRLRSAPSDDNIGTKLDQLGSKQICRRSRDYSEPVFELEILTFDITKFPETVFHDFNKIWNLRRSQNTNQVGLSRLLSARSGR